ncbi:hypothetical protein LJR118_002135 [Acidovorax sp. LjRoot118]|uniref:hypothetical protein n=1 Tax=Acidovorax sp. LjRoot118 TaxID=3342256 RepID=UPI003ED15A0D
MTKVRTQQRDNHVADIFASAEQAADGKWIPASCTVTVFPLEYPGSEGVDHDVGVSGTQHATENEAISAGIDAGRDWFENGGWKQK